MAGIRTLPKLTGSGIDPQISQWAAQIVDTLNPALRELATATDFRWLEVDGVNGAAPTFALQLAQGFGWTTIAQFDVGGRLFGQSAWIPFPYAANWSDFDGGSMPGGYFKDAMGFVRLRGLNKWSQLTNPIPPGTVIGTLPVGYRPSAGIALQVANWNGASYVAGVIDILPSGAVRVQLAANGGANTSGLDLSGISFDTRS